MAKNAFLDWDTTASNNTDIGGIGILGSNAVKNFDDAFRTAMAQLRSGVDGKVVYAAKSGNYTAVANDNNAVLRFTASATLSLTAAATLATNWHVTVIADGGAVTIDPNASETINGLSTLVVPNGATTEIICDGSNFFTVLKPSVWSSIGVYTMSAATTLPMTGLAGYLALRAEVYIVNSANATVGFRVSIDNGASYISTANHLSQTLVGSISAAGAGTSSSQTFAQVSGNPLGVCSFTTTINNWNSTALAAFHSKGYGADGSNQFSFANGAFSPTTASARNALQLLLGGAGNMTGYVILEGVRA